MDDWKNAMNKEQNPHLEQVIDDFSGQIADIDESLLHDIVGIAHAMDDVRKSLDKLDEYLNERQFEKAAQLGYQDISSAHIFLQRTLGALQRTVHRKESVICDVAGKMRAPYEDVEPSVTMRFKYCQPRPPMPIKERAVIERIREKLIASEQSGFSSMTAEEILAEFKAKNSQ